jgi:8-oxo-dGTP diphosphatase
MTPRARAAPPGADSARTGGHEADRPARLAVAVDVALISTHDRDLRTLLFSRSEAPCQGCHALPGGFVGTNESLSEAAARICQTQAGVDDVFLEQLFTFEVTHRDPHTRVLSVTYYALIEESRFGRLAARGPATVATLRVPWKGERGGAVGLVDDQGQTLPMAFDHDRILGLVVKRLRGKVAYMPIALALVRPSFTLLALRRVYEAILGHALNKDSFRRTLQATGWIRPTGKWQSGVLHRPAELYTATPEARRALAPG